MSTPNCACPLDSPIQLLAKFSNNLALTLKTLAMNKWTGQLVSLIGRDGCGCTEMQILAAMNNNLVSFLSFFSQNSNALGTKSGIVDVALNDVTKAVVFATPFAAMPSVMCIVAAQDGTGFVISPGLDGGSVTAAGFTAMFAAAIPQTGYKMFWIATPTTQ